MRCCSSSIAVPLELDSKERKEISQEKERKVQLNKYSLLYFLVMHTWLYPLLFLMDILQLVNFLHVITRRLKQYSY